MKRFFQRVFIFLFIAVVVVVVWFFQSRKSAPGRAMSYQELSLPAPTPGGTTRLRVGTYNIAHGRGGKYGASNWSGKSREELEAHLKKIAAQIKEANLDIVILNEVDFASTWSRSFDQAELIAREAKFPFLLEQRNMDASIPFFTMAFGNAILSRYPISEQRYIDFPSYSAKEAYFAGDHDGVLCNMETPIGVVRVMAVHLEHRSEAIRVESAKMIAGIAAEKNTPMIVLGDFNSAPKGFKVHALAAGANAVDYLLSDGFDTELPAQTVENLTFPSEKPDRIIDWVLTTPQLEQSNRTVYDSTLSDHKMLSVTVKLK